MTRRRQDGCGGRLRASAGGLVLALGALALACTPATDPSPGSSGSTGSTSPTGAPPPAGSAPSAPDFLRFPPVDAGVLVSSSATHTSSTRVYPRDLPHLAVELRACRLLWPGRLAYDMTWSAPPGLALPATITFVLTRQVAKASSSVEVDATLAGPGAFTLLWDDRARPEGTERGATGAAPTRASERAPRTWTAERSSVTAAMGGSCAVDVRSERPADIATNGGRIRVDIARPQVTAPERSVEGLFRHIDPTDPSDPLLPLLALFDQPTWPAIDRLWIAPDTAMSSVTIAQQATCITVTSVYEQDVDSRERSGAAGIRVVQRRGCPAAADLSSVGEAETVIRIVDDEWDVLVIGGRNRASELIAHLSELPFAGPSGVAPTPGGFDASAYLDEWYRQHPGDPELGRAAWRDGQVGLTLRQSEVSRHPVLDLEVVEAVPGERLNAGGSGTNCSDMAVHQTGNTQHGYVAIVATARVTRVRYTDATGPHDLDLTPSRQPGYRFGFIAEPALPTRPNRALQVALTFLDEAGAEVPCVQ